VKLARVIPIMGVALIGGCEAAARIQYDCQSVNEPRIQLHTNDVDADRAYMVVGGSGWVEMFGTDPVSTHSGVSAVFISSDTSVVAVHGDSLFARAVGNVIIVGKATCGGFVDTAAIEVTATPVPVDYVRLLFDGITGSGLDAVYDSSGSLTEVTLPLHRYFALWYQVYRGADWRQIYVMADTITSSNPDAVLITRGCLPPSLDAWCGYSAGWWVSGMDVGESTVTVAVHNVIKTLKVKVT